MRCTPLLIALAAAAGAAGCGPGGAEFSRAPRPAEPPPPAPVQPFAIGRPDLVLLVTGGTGGALEVCDCEDAKLGGLARRSGLVRSYRAAVEHAFLLDTGDVLAIWPDDLRNDYVLTGYARVGYDAVVLADREWAVGPAKLRARLAAGPEYLSTSVAPADGPAMPIRTVVTRRFGDVKLAVVSHLGDDALMFFSGEQLGELRRSGVEDVEALISRLKADGHLVVLVSHGSRDAAAAAARRTTADVVIRGHAQVGDEGLRRVGGCLLVQAGGAEAVGVLALRLEGGRIAAAEWRLEPVDARWPIDARLIELFEAFVQRLSASTRPAERPAPPAAAR